MAELVSAIITTKNRKELLLRAINSVLTQTYGNIEMIVVDDGSQDGTDICCQNLPLKYIYIPSNESRGGNYARNLGIKAATGRYVAFLDDDDYWMPEKIEKQVSLMLNSDCELVYCGRKLEKIKNGQTHYVDSYIREKEPCKDIARRILYHIPTTTSNIMIKRDALLEVGLFDENLRFWQEYELLIRLAQRKLFYFVQEPLMVYRIDFKDKGRLTNKYYAWKKAVRYVFNKHHNLYEKQTEKEKLLTKKLVAEDARQRCKAGKLWFHAWIWHLRALYIKKYIKYMKCR